MNDSIGYSIKKLHLATRQLLDQGLVKYGLSQAQSEIIYYLLQENGQTQADLGRKLKVAAPTVTKMIDGLLEKGFVTRRGDKVDARRKLICLTPKGSKFKNEIASVQRQVEATLRHGFSKAEIATAQKYVDRMYENVTRTTVVNRRSSSST